MESYIETTTRLMEAKPVVAEVGMGVEVSRGSISTYHGIISAVRSKGVHLTISVGNAEYDYIWRGGSWRWACGSERTITHKGRPVVPPGLPDNEPASTISLPDSGESAEEVEIYVGMEFNAASENDPNIFEGVKPVIAEIHADGFSFDPNRAELGNRIKYEWAGDDFLCRRYPDSKRVVTDMKTGKRAVMPSLPDSGVVLKKADNLNTSESSCSKDADNCARKIEVGAHFWRKSDGKLCVVTLYDKCGSDDVYAHLVRLREEEAHLDDSWNGGALLKRHEYAYTPAKDLSNMNDGDKIIDMDTGEVVTVEVDVIDWRWLQDGDARTHSVNGLPAAVAPNGYRAWDRHGAFHREEGVAIEYSEGGHKFCLHGEKLTPAEWAREIVTNDEYDADKVEPEWKHLIDAAKAEALRDLGDKRLYRSRQGEYMRRAIAYFSLDGWTVEMLDWEGKGYGDSIGDAAKDAVEVSNALNKRREASGGEEELFAELSGGGDGQFEAFWVNPAEWEAAKAEAEEVKYLGPWAVQSREGGKYPAVIYWTCQGCPNVAKFKDRRVAKKVCHIFNEHYHRQLESEVRDA
jgi:hypothetical protein